MTKDRPTYKSKADMPFSSCSTKQRCRCCGGYFHAARSSAKYCSKRCKQKRYREDKKTSGSEGKLVWSYEAQEYVIQKELMTWE